VCASLHLCVHVCVRVCVYMCVRAGVCNTVHADCRSSIKEASACFLVRAHSLYSIPVLKVPALMLKAGTAAPNTAILQPPCFLISKRSACTQSCIHTHKVMPIPWHLPLTPLSCTKPLTNSPIAWTSPYLTHSHTHTYTHTHTHARTHSHTHTHTNLVLLHVPALDHLV